MSIPNDIIGSANVSYLGDPFEQYCGLNGKPLIGGHIEVYLAGTSDKYMTLQDFDGDYNPFKVPLGADGRVVMLADPSLTYDIYVYNSYNDLVCSRLNVECTCPGNISIKGADTWVRNTDGTLDISLRTSANNRRVFDVNTRNKILDVQSPLYFVENSQSATVIGIKGGASGYVTKDYVDSAVSGKLDITAFSAVSGDFLTDKFEYDDNFNVTGYNGSAFASNGETYSAGTNIDITDNVISVTGLPTSSDVENAISSAVTNVENKFEYNENNYITAYNNSAFAGKEYSAGDYVSIVNDTISVTGLQPSGDYATHDDLTAYQPSGDYATKEDLASATSGKQDTLSAGDGISIVNNTISVTAQGGSGITAVNHDNTLSGNGNSEPLGLANAEDYATRDDLSAYATTALVSSVSSELYSAFSGLSGDFELVAGSGVELVDDPNAKTTTINVTAQGGNKEVENLVIANSGTWNTVSDKLDTTAFSTVSGDFLTAVPDTYLQNTDLTIVDNKITEISGVPLSAGDELPASVSAATDYVTATSADINATIDNVSANSGVWGGSALPISAGPGIKFELVNDTLVASTDETVLFSGNFNTKSCTLSESPLNFDRVRFYLADDGGHTSWGSTEIKSDLLNNISSTNGQCMAGCAVPWSEGFRIMTVSATSANDYRNWNSCGYQWWGNNGGQIGTGYLNIIKVIGINRIAGGN